MFAKKVKGGTDDAPEANCVCQGGNADDFSRMSDNEADVIFRRYLMRLESYRIVYAALFSFSKICVIFSFNFAGGKGLTI